MMRRFEELKRYSVKALHNEDVGHLRDLYLSSDGLIRYLVVDTNMAGFINRQVVLLSPTAIRAIPTDSTEIETDLEFDKIRTAPSALDDMLPSYELSRRIDAHYGWDSRLSATSADREGLVSLASLLHRKKVEARDGTIGPLKEALLDLSTFRVCGLIVDAGNWLHARPIVLDAHQIDFHADADRLHAAVDLATIRSAPKFDPYAPTLPEEALR